MADPDYQEYSAWMDRNAPIPRLFAYAKTLAGNRVRIASGQVEPAE